MNETKGAEAVIRPVSIVLAVALAAIVAGCGGGGSAQDKVVARAGEIEVTLADFHSAWNAITPTYRPDISTLEGKRSFANDLVNQQILLAEGREMGGITDPALIQQVEQTRQQKMLQILYRQEVEDKVDVLGSDVKELYDNRQVNVTASHILLNSKEDAERVRQEIASGKISFEDAARKYSMDQNSGPRGGSLGEIQWGRTVPEFQKRAFEMEPGKLSEPFETNFGWHILTVHERLPQEMGTLEELRPSLRNDARRQMEQERLREYVASLQDAAGLEWNDDAILTLQKGIERMASQDVDTVAAEDRSVPILSEEEQAEVIASWNGGEFTIGDYVEGVRQQPAGSRAPGAIPFNGLKELIRTSYVRSELLEAEAERLGLGDLEEVASEDRRLRERILVETVHARFLQAADVPEEDVKAVYDSTLAENPDALLLPERVNMMIVTHSDQAVVEQALKRIRAGEPEEEVVRELTMEPRTREQGGHTGLIARGNYAPQVEEVAFDPDRVGKGWSDPIVTGSGIGAVKVLEYQEPRVASFEELKNNLTRTLAQARGEEAFEEWLQEKREERGVEIYDDVLELYGQPIS
jgi:peptidyl-prolyl cis-trans isomerase C